MASSKNTLRTPLGKVRGLGAAKRGTDHFIAQRITAIALIPLAIWFIWAIAAHTNGDYAATVAFIAHPVNAVLLALFALTGIYHFVLGLQVVIEDYVSAEGLKIASLLLNKFVGIVLGVAVLLAILKLAL